MDNFILFH